jgi:hypothetical protein
MEANSRSAGMLEDRESVSVNAQKNADVRWLA